MIEKTFIHVPNVSAGLERRIWGAGITSWSDFFEHHRALKISAPKKERMLSALESSQEKLSRKNSLYFKENLPRKEHWRMYSDFKDQAAFLDIETTGLGFDNDITLIGLYDGKRMRSFILGDNLDEFPSAVRKHKILLTYNGTCFDLPFIHSKFPDLQLNQAHIDLRFVLRRIGLSGGLKSIEEQAGLSRSERTHWLGRGPAMEGIPAGAGSVARPVDRVQQ